MGAKNGKIVGRPDQKIWKKMKNRCFYALQAAFEPIYNASGVKNMPGSIFEVPGSQNLAKKMI